MTRLRNKPRHQLQRPRSGRRMMLESLETRNLLAAVSDGVLGLLQIELAADEDLQVVSAGTTYGFTTNQTFTDSGVGNALDFSGFGTASLTLEISGLAAYDTISIVDASGATDATVTFNDSVANDYTDHFSIALDDIAAGAITFNGQSLESILAPGRCRLG